jgi:hydrogenase maturation protease
LILKNGLLTPNFFSFGEEREKNGSTVCLVTMKTLIIGYGNQNRRDDGVGWFILEQLAALKLPDVELETSHQLEVEASETISRFDAVIFVDAAIPEAPEAIQRSVVTPNFQSHAVAHYLTPADVLSLCKTLYQREPKAVLFSIRGRDFNFGTTLTPEVEQAAREVVKQIAELVRSGKF